MVRYQTGDHARVYGRAKKPEGRGVVGLRAQREPRDGYLGGGERGTRRLDEGDAVGEDGLVCLLRE